MYDYLGVSYHAQRFVFEFAEAPNGGEHRSRSKGVSTYFIHTSNNHILPPIRPTVMPILEHVVEMVYLVICYSWYTICGFVVTPRPSTNSQLCETFEEYLRRIWLPQYFITYYLLPLMSAVTTCSHQALLRFPAQDLIEYKRRSHGEPHFTVTKGVQEVQGKLARGLEVKFQSKVHSIEHGRSGVTVWWVRSERDKERVEGRRFDQVILAVPPNVVGSICAPLQPKMARIPTIQVRSVVIKALESNNAKRLQALHETGRRENYFEAQKIRLVNRFDGEGWTESCHEQAPGMTVTTCPLGDPVQGHELHSAWFTRVLRTPESRDIVNSIFDPESDRFSPSTAWKNGDGGIWLVGGWAWDGMVLLEGCVSSAMRVAEALEVDIPWRDR